MTANDPSRLNFLDKAIVRVGDQGTVDFDVKEAGALIDL